LCQLKDGIHTNIPPNQQNQLNSLAMISLRKSTIRRKIVEYLFDIHPHYSYISDIASNVRTQRIYVIDSISPKGPKSSKYSDIYSLLALGLVEELIYGKNQKLYRITDFGKDIVKKMQNEYLRR
jgi:uncharacterized protein